MTARILRRRIAAIISATLVVAVLGVTGFARTAAAATPSTLSLRVLLIGEGPSDPTTAAWQSALASEGVPYTLATASGGTVTLPQLSSGTTGNFNGVVLAGSPTGYAPGELSALFAYESAFGVRQIDGYMFPSPALGVTDATVGPLDGTTGTLTAAGLSAFPGLKGPVPMDTGTFGYGATVNSGAPYTTLLNDSAGHSLAGVYEHPSGDPQAGVSELALTFNYNENSLQWLLLGPGLINWVTQNTHLGLYRNYFGQDIDDIFIADNEWSSQYQCTPGATEPPDYTCPAGVANNPADTPPDVVMSAADVAHVVAWQQQSGITLNLAFNAVGACMAPSPAQASSANCTGSVTHNGVTYTNPGQAVDPTATDAAALVNAFLANQSEFYWMNHTWSHQFLGCIVWQPQVLSSVAANPAGGSLAAGSYSYVITAATAYGESEPSLPQPATVISSSGSVTVAWPEANNGTGTDGTPAPTLAQEQASHTGGTGFWGYNIYRADPGSTTYGLVGQVAENPSATAATTYSFTDTGTAAGAAPGSSDVFPTATNPGINCSSAPGSWDPATSATPDSSIAQEIALGQAFGSANGLTNYDPSVLVTGEHSGLENPNLGPALSAVGVTTFASDASRQPQQYSIGTATAAPRYPSNIYYNAANWADQLNEYNTIYTANGVALPGGGTGHCTDTSFTTCLATPATQASFLAAESHIMLTHVLANDPRVGYAHQANLIGPDYTILDLIDTMLDQYNSWFTDPITPLTQPIEVQVMSRQGAWAAANTAATVSATVTNGVVTITNSGTAVEVPVTVPPGTTVNGAPFGQAYAGQRSDWLTVGSTPVVLNENVAPTITSSAAATSIVGAPFTFTIYTTGAPTPAITETGALPSGLTLTDNGNGTATISGTSATGSGGSYPITISAANGAVATQAFVLTNAEAPSITSAAATTFVVGTPKTYTVTTTGYPPATITESGALPAGLAFTANADGTATISGTATGPASSTVVTISATNISGSTATLSLTITVNATAAAMITSASSAYFTLGQAGAVAVTTTGAPIPVITETGALPAGLTFTDNHNGTALISGTPTATGTTLITVTATNSGGTDTQVFTFIVGQAPAFTSPASAAFIAGTASTFSITTSGYPPAAIGQSGLPADLSFLDNGDGTATISGTPSDGDVGAHAVTLTAVNGTGTVAQALTLTVSAAPAPAAPVITSAGSVLATGGTPFSFTVTTSGTPTPTLTLTGTLPDGVTFTAHPDGTATLAGTPSATAVGVYPLTFTARNSTGVASQGFTLTVGQAPPVTSAPAPTETAGTAPPAPASLPTLAVTGAGVRWQIPLALVLVLAGAAVLSISRSRGSRHG